MTLTPLTNASPVVQIHAALALLAVAITVGIFTLPKGSPLHRTLGWVWVIAMAGTATSSFWITEMRVIGPFSPIHILSIVTLVTLVFAVRDARGHRVARHKRRMQLLTFGALVVAGGFTLLPGRIMHAVILGG